MGVDKNGTFVSILELRTVIDEKLESFGKAVFESGEWKKAEITWDKPLKKQLEGKIASIDEMFYDAENMLSLSFAEYSLPYSEYETIRLATQEGIFEAEYGEDEFHRIIHAEKDNLYYLTPDSYEPEVGGVLWKGSHDDYMLSLVGEGEDRGVNCYYSRPP